MQEGLEFKLRRIRLRVKQKDLAVQAGTHGSVICDYESGYRPVSAEILRKMTAILDAVEGVESSGQEPAPPPNK